MTTPQEVRVLEALERLKPKTAKVGRPPIWTPRMLDVAIAKIREGFTATQIFSVIKPITGGHISSFNVAVAKRRAQLPKGGRKAVK